MEPAHDSGQKPVKHQRCLGAGAMYALSDAVQSMSGAFVSESTSSALLPASTDCITRAIQVVEAEEEEYGPESLMSAVDLFYHDPKYPITYLAFNKKEMRSMWFHRELRKAADWDMLDFSLFPDVNRQ